jgi:acetyl-CoA carboxylase biotin carboxyl carrier protein
MSDDKLTYQELLQIVELIKSASHLSEFRLKRGELELDLKRGDTAIHPQTAPAPATPSPSEPSTVAEAATRKQRHGHIGGGEVVVEGRESGASSAAGAPDAEISPRAAPPLYPPGAIMIKSPMVGTFYRAPEPGAKPFVEVGQLVEASTTVCVIEVMKLFNSISAGHKGIVTHILVEDSEPVEYGQLLMVIEPRE